MTKIAILLFGQARFYKNNKSILDIKSQYDCDVFIHTWERDDETFESRPNNKIPPFRITKNDIIDYIKIYNPKKYLIEKELEKSFIDSKFTKSDFSKTKGLCTSTKYNLYSYLYSLNKCVGLIDNIYDYDFLIPTRSDMVNLKIPNLNNLSKDKMYIPIIKNHEDRGYMNSDYVDLSFSIIPSDLINKHCDLLNKIEFYYDKGYSFGWEEMFYANLIENSLINSTISMNSNELSYQLKRDEFGYNIFIPY